MADLQMDMVEAETFQYISHRLFTEEKPVLFTDLIFRFKMGPSRSKKIMFSYYKQNTTTRFNCIIVTCHNNGTIKVVSDVNSLGDESSIIDCFIYAFDPMEKFIPVNTLVDQHDCLSIRNPYKLKAPPQRAKTVEEKTAAKVVTPALRSKTVPDKKETEANPTVSHSKPAKSTGLRSTAILAKMRAERENKEAQRQEELRKRRTSNQPKKSDPKQSAQMKELQSLFTDDDAMQDEDIVEDDDHAVDADVPTPETEGSTPLDKKELEDLLETTTEDTTIASQSSQKQQAETEEHSSQPEEAVSSYVDEDGYIVTKRAVTSTPPQSSKKRPLKTTSGNKKTTPSTKKTQGTLESFFKKPKKSM